MSTRSKKPKVWRAWCAVYEHADGPVLASLNIIEYPLTYIAFLTRKAARKVYPDHRIARVEIREIPRKRKPTVTRATDAASRVWWADVDRAAKSAQALRDKPKRKGKRT